MSCHVVRLMLSLHFGKSSSKKEPIRACSGFICHKDKAYSLHSELVKAAQNLYTISSVGMYLPVHSSARPEGVFFNVVHVSLVEENGNIAIRVSRGLDPYLVYQGYEGIIRHVRRNHPAIIRRHCRARYVCNDRMSKISW